MPPLSCLPREGERNAAGCPAPLRPARARRLRLAGRSAPPAYIGGPLPPSLHAHPFPAVSSSFPPLASPLPSPRAGGGRSERASERAGAGLLLGAWLGSAQARRSCREPPALGGVRSGSHERRGGGLLGLAPKVAAREEVETLRKCSSPRLAAARGPPPLLSFLPLPGAGLACLPSPAFPRPRRRPSRGLFTFLPLSGVRRAPPRPGGRWAGSLPTPPTARPPASQLLCPSAKGAFRARERFAKFFERSRFELLSIAGR